MSKTKILNIVLIITSLMVYLEWGTENKMFLIQGEIDLFSKMFKDPMSVLHPFILLPLIGQLILIFTLFQKQPSRMLTYLGLGGIGVLVAFIFVIGLISFKYKIAISTLPFLITGFLILRNQKRLRKGKS